MSSVHSRRQAQAAVVQFTCAHERMVEALWLWLVGAQASNSSKSLIDTMDRIESNLVQHTAGTAKQANTPNHPLHCRTECGAAAPQLQADALQPVCVAVPSQYTGARCPACVGTRREPAAGARSAPPAAAAPAAHGR